MDNGLALLRLLREPRDESFNFLSIEKFPRLIGKSWHWQDILTPPGWPLWRMTYLFTTLVWKMPPSWHWTGRSEGY